MAPESHLDIENQRSLTEYLRRTGRIRAGERIVFRILAGGVSNRTVLVGPESGGLWVLKQALSKLRVPVDWFCAPERIEREALGMQWLERIAPAGSITQLIFCDPAQHVLAMEAVPEPHSNWKSLLLSGIVDSGHFRSFGNLLASIHAGGYERRAELAEFFADRSYFEALRLEPYYTYTSSQVPAASAFLTILTRDTRQSSITLVHGDYSPKNVLIREQQLVLLDHEVIHWGDPAFDIGFAMGHFLSKARHLADHREALQESTLEFWRAYRKQCDLAAEERCVRHALACLLARVTGRSQLEYLSAQEKVLQRDWALRLMQSAPGMENLILGRPGGFLAH